MSDYLAPLKDMRFVIERLGPLAEIAQLPGYEDATPDVVDAVLEEAGKLAAGVLSPLNRIGDTEGARHTGDGVRTTPLSGPPPSGARTGSPASSARSRGPRSPPQSQ